MTFLLFDAFGTLVHLDDFYGRLQRGFLAETQTAIPFESARRAAHCEMRHYIKHSLRAQQNDERDILRHQCAQILADALREENANWDFSHENAYRVLDSSIVFRAYDETREVLQQLADLKIPLGVLSNWDGALTQVLRDLQLDGFFEFVVSSAQIGHEKPDLQFFNFGLEKIRALHPQIETQSCIYIGDHWEKDIVPARASGMQALWIVRDKRDFTSGETVETQAATRLSSLHDIFRVLDINHR